MYGKLDVLINNAGIALLPSSLTDLSQVYTTTFSTNTTSVALLTSAFLPLLTASGSSSSTAPKLINISSARGSLTRSTAGKLPPTATVAYSVSKTALNALTIEFQKTANPAGAGGGGGQGIRFYAASPGHLKTALNNFRGEKDPLDGAEVVVRLVCGEYVGGMFWEFEGGEMREAPW